ncbi:MAG: chromate transporter [Peptoniphilaceae bacterium]|nr:chromate transporter [Peptoniphilaceae bacterium]MDY3986544.1 chromate transporter [Peptoniphilaceae bacterium]
MKEASTEKGTITLPELFLTLFKINTFTFGGGYTIVPVIRDEFVKKKRLLDEEEMLNLTALAQSGPGPMAINTSLLTGYRVLGPIGAITALCASVLPCLIIITVLFYVYRSLRSNPWVSAAFRVMGGVISGILVITTLDMARVALKKHRIFGLLLMVGAFSANYFLHWNAVIIIVVSGLTGLALFSLVEESRVL